MSNNNHNSKQQAAALEQLQKQNKVLHESIIDLYLQVKIRSNDEVINVRGLISYRLITSMRVCLTRRGRDS